MGEQHEQLQWLMLPVNGPTALNRGKCYTLKPGTVRSICTVRSIRSTIKLVCLVCLTIILLRTLGRTFLRVIVVTRTIPARWYDLPSITYYISDDAGQTIRTTTDAIEWARWFSRAERHVAHTEVGTLEVSTVFLGMDHGFNFSGEHRPPVLWETMIFADEGDDSELHMEQWRYSSYKAAVEGHKEIVDRLQASTAAWQDTLAGLGLVRRLDT